MITVDARPCDAQQIVEQIGVWTLMAVSGLRTARIYNSEGETVGISLPINNTRRVDIVLDWDDTYIVRRIRRITSGKNKGQEVTEDEFRNIYCDQVSHVAYTASCWK